MKGIRILLSILCISALIIFSSCDLNQHKEKKKERKHRRQSELMVDNRKNTKPLSKGGKGKEVAASPSSKGKKVRILSVTANYTHLSRQGKCTYSPLNLTDGDKSTAFIIPTPGRRNLQLTFKLDGSKVRKLKIRNGYQKSSRTFTDHGRVGSIRVYAYDGNNYVDELCSSDLYDVNGSEEMKLPKISEYYDRIVLEFPSEDLIIGDAYDELAISEIELYR